LRTLIVVQGTFPSELLQHSVYALTLVILLFSVVSHVIRAAVHCINQYCCAYQIFLRIHGRTTQVEAVQVGLLLWIEPQVSGGKLFGVRAMSVVFQ
jgi:hypothetical protein